MYNAARLAKRPFRPWVLLTMFAVGSLFPDWSPTEAGGWKPVDLGDMSVQPGSALDFSFLVEEGPAGKYGPMFINPEGHFAFRDRPGKAVRFFCAPQGIGTSESTPFQDNETWAEQIRMAGYNAVRLHFLDQELMNGSTAEGVLNPAKVDLNDRYTAALKKRGIYLCLDLSSSWAAFTIYKSWEKGAQGVNMKQRLCYDEKARDLWKRGVRQMIEHVNPYTGLALKDEPQLLWAALRNESGLNFLGPTSDPGLVAPFRTWLEKRYGNAGAWAAAWGPGRVGDLTFATVPMPTLKDKGPVAADLQRFITEIEQATYKWGLDYVRSLGLKVPVIDYNNGGSMQSTLSRDVLPFVDNHVYHDHPYGAWLSPGMYVEQNNSLERQMGDFRWVVATRLLGKPFTMTEWGGVFWNRFRHQDGLGFGAYASLQNWSLLAQHATPVLPDLGVPGAKGSCITPFQVAKDPVAKANERIVAFLFGRGDVAPSPHRVEIRLDARTLYDRLPLGDAFSYSITPISLLTGLGSRVVNGERGLPPAPYTPDMVVEPEGGAEIRTIAAAELAGDQGAGKGTEAILSRLREKGVLSGENRTDLQEKIFESDTRELCLRAATRQFTVNTPRSLGLCLREGGDTLSVGALEAENHGPCASVFVTSLTPDPIAKSKRLLVILLGDALNSEMSFTDESRKVLGALGHGPVVLETLRATLRLALEAPASWQGWALAANGSRAEALRLEKKGGRLILDLNTADLAKGPTAYFELARP